MSKDRDTSMNDGNETASRIIQESATAVAGLIGWPTIPEAARFALKDYPVIVVGHALISFLDAKHEEHPLVDYDSEATRSRSEKILKEWLISWRRDHPGHTEQDLSQAIKTMQWLAQMSEGGQ